MWESCSLEAIPAMKRVALLEGLRERPMQVRCIDRLDWEGGKGSGGKEVGGGCSSEPMPVGCVCVVGKAWRLWGGRGGD